MPGADSTIAQGINNAGTIVGLYIVGELTHGFVLSNGLFTTVDEPNASGRTEIRSINAKGEIVETYVDSDGVEHGFLGVPAR